MAFNLSFAGVPLCLDGAFSFCIPNSKDANPVIPDRLKGLLKHEPEVDLMDEIERVAPLLYAEEFSYEDNYTGRNLGGIAHPWNLTPMKSLIRLGDFYYPTTAGKWGVFRGIVGTKQRDAILNVTQGNSDQELLIYSDINIGTNTNVSSNARIRTNMFMLPPRPLSNYGSQFEQLHLITLVDDRFYMQNTGVSFKKADLATWDTLIASFALQAGISVTYSTISTAFGYPESDSPLWTNGESTATLFDAIAYNIGRTVVRNLNGTYSLLTPAESQAIVQANVLNVPTTQGGEILYSGALGRNSVIPASVTVTFPKYVTGDDPVPHFLNSRTRNQPQSLWYQESYGEVFSISVPTTSGGIYASGLSGTSTSTIHTTAKALISGENQSIPVNISGLNALAMQIASDIYTTSIIGIDQSFDGIWNFTPDGLHDLVWTYSRKAKGAFTRIVKNNWNINIWERQHSLALSGQTNYLKGVGGPLVPQTIRDSYSGSFTTNLNIPLNSGSMTAVVTAVDYLPTQNRWRGTIDNESLLFEGTSGGIASSGGGYGVGIVYRAIDGTLQGNHVLGSTVRQTLPNVSYGVNLTTYEKGQFVSQANWTSGGITETRVIPQTQSVRVLDGAGLANTQGVFYSGRVNTYDSKGISGSLFVSQEYVWIVERNGSSVSSGTIYDGQLVGYSQYPSAPVYAINGSTTFTILSGTITSTMLASGAVIPNLSSGMQLINQSGNYTYIQNLFGYPGTGYSSPTQLLAAYGGYDWNYYKIVNTSLYHAAGPPLMFTGLSLTTNAFGEGYMYAVPFMETRGGTVDRIAARLIQLASNAGSVIRFGIYTAASTTSLYPGALVVDGGTVAVDAGLNTKIEVSVSAVIPVGLNFLVVRTGTGYGINAPAIQVIGGQASVYNWSLFGVIGTGGNGLDITQQTNWTAAWVINGLGADAALPATFPVGANLTTVDLSIAFPVLFRRYSA
jgi:hypothetical protein